MQKWGTGMSYNDRFIRAIRQEAVDRVRDAIERSTRNVHDDRWRILVKPQGDLWDEGVKAGIVLKDAPVDESGDDDENNNEGTTNNNAPIGMSSRRTLPC